MKVAVATECQPPWCGFVVALAILALPQPLDAQDLPQLVAALKDAAPVEYQARLDAVARQDAAMERLREAAPELFAFWEASGNALNNASLRIAEASPDDWARFQRVILAPGDLDHAAYQDAQNRLRASGGPYVAAWEAATEARQKSQALLAEAAPNEWEIYQLAGELTAIARLFLAAAAPEEWEALTRTAGYPLRVILEPRWQ